MWSGVAKANFLWAKTYFPRPNRRVLSYRPQNIYWNGKNYLATAAYDDPSTDLKIFKVSTPFSSWAPLYTGTSETSKRAMVFGRGTTRGAEVKKGATLKGWKWGTQDKVRSWGENTVDGTYNGGTGLGTLLKFDFDRYGLTNEGTLSTGDSGGGVFINDGGKWKLAGINYGVEVPFSFTGLNNSGFNAAIFDKGGLYVGGNNAWKYTTDVTADVPATWYATRISSRQSWIKSIIGTAPTSGAAVASAGAVDIATVPEPSGVVVVGIAGVALIRRRDRRRRARGAALHR